MTAAAPILNICDYLGYSQHTGECWVDTIQQIFFFTDGLKELTQPLFYTMTDEELHAAIEAAVAKGIIPSDVLTPAAAAAPTAASNSGSNNPPVPVNANNYSNNAPLMAAVKKGDIAQVNTLLSSDESMDYINFALLKAAEKGHVAIVRALLKKDVDINFAMNQGWTALMTAASSGDLSIVNAILESEKDVNVNLQTRDGWTPLMSAAVSGNLPIVNALLEKGADANIQNDNKQTALTYAVDGGYAEIVESLQAKLRTANNTPFLASSVHSSPAYVIEKKSLASIHEQGIKAMRDRFINHYNVIVHDDEEECLVKGPQQIKQLYKASVAGTILLKRFESKRLGVNVATGLVAKEHQQARLNSGGKYETGAFTRHQISVNNMLFRTFNLPFLASWLVTGVDSKAPIHALGISMRHIAGMDFFEPHATGFLKCKGQWYYYNDNTGLFAVSDGLIDALQTALKFNDGLEHDSICIKTIKAEDRDICHLLTLPNVITTYKYEMLGFNHSQTIRGDVMPGKIWTETGWVDYDTWKETNSYESYLIEHDEILTPHENGTPCYYNVVKGAYSIIKYEPALHATDVLAAARKNEDTDCIALVTADVQAGGNRKRSRRKHRRSRRSRKLRRRI